MRVRHSVAGSLVIKHIWFGIERFYWMMALLLAMFAFMIMNEPMISVLAILPLLIGRFLTAIDPDLLRVYLKYSRQSLMYAPISSVFASRNKRPQGYGR